MNVSTLSKYLFQKMVPVISTVVVVEGEDEGRTNETLAHGTDNDGKKYRTILKFDLTDFSESMHSLFYSSNCRIE